MNIRSQERALQYDMTPDEMKTYRLAVTWEEITKKMFPGRQGLARLAKGDPRRCSLFHDCWKLMRTTRGLLRDDEYPLYMMANLQLLKIRDAYIAPSTLCGDKAWVRWKVWKRLYDLKKQDFEVQDLTEGVDPKIVRQLDLTKRFLFEKCEGEPTVTKIQEFFDNKSFKLFTMSGRICMYYVVLSPFVKQCQDMKDLESELGFDSAVFVHKISDKVRKYFEHEYAYEFETV